MQKRQRPYILEVCTDSTESAIAAYKGGADRLELCGNLMIGGTTPSVSLFDEIKKVCPQMRIHVLIRPRFGDFLYTEHEFSIITQEVELFAKRGADGIVAGCLQKDGKLDLEKMKRLRECAKDCHMTLHRAFDVCCDPLEALEQAKSIGIQTILTSGQRKTCEEGRQLIEELAEQAAGEIDIMAGSGVDAQVIQRMLQSQTAIKSFHMSGKMIVESGMEYRKEGVPMGIEGFDEFQIFRTDELQVQRARKILDQAEKEL